jgi:uncharacterized protein (DUF1697 family)
LPTVVALLRGVNVGGRKVPMAELRDVVESLGYGDVRTYIQSGNVLFESARKPAPGTLESAIEKRFGLQVDVMLRTPTELRKVLERDPFPTADRSSVHVGFMARAPKAADVRAIDASSFAPEEFAVVGSELYLHLPNGLGRSKFPDFVLRRLKIPTTLRNWRTVTKLAELAGD